jgi:hypothetical protein
MADIEPAPPTSSEAGRVTDNDNGDAIVYLLRRWQRTSNKATAIYSVRGPDGWKHTMVDRAKTWSLVIEHGRRVVECWVRRSEAA